MKHVWAVILVAGLTAMSASADMLLGWDLTNTAANAESAPSDFNAANILAGDITRGAGLATATGTNRFSASSWTVGGGTLFSDAVLSNDYFSFTITAASGFELSITNFSARIGRSGTGPTNFYLASSYDNFATPLFSTQRTSQASYSLGNSVGGHYQLGLNLGGSGSGLTSLEFRVYASSAGGASGTAYLDGGGVNIADGMDVAIFGSVSAVPEPSAVAFFGLAGLVLYATQRRARRPV